MAYSDIENNYQKQLEFRELEDVPKFQDYVYWSQFDKLQPTVTQLFVKRYVTPTTQVSRILLKMGTGTGKTLTSLLVAQTFNKLTKQYYDVIGRKYSSIIIGFSREVYRRELLKYPELGIITADEKNKLINLFREAKEADGEIRDKLFQQRKSLLLKIKKRISSPNHEGFYQFFGYKELFNSLFISELDSDVSSENVYKKYKNNEIKINNLILKQFEKSYIICDEIHMVYNSEELNNYGIAIQFILDYYKDNITALFLSATIINNNKRELIDIANLIKDYKTPHFESNKYFGNKSVSLQPIFDEFVGKVVFLEENTSDYPDLYYMGKNLKMTGKKDYIKFTECKMTPLHETTYQAANLYSEKTNNNIIHDMIVPNPDYSAKDILEWNPDHPNFKNRNMEVIGMFDVREIKEKLFGASQDWKKKIGISISIEKDYFIMSGTWLKYENLKIYSQKGVEFLNIIRKELKENPLIKILVYHHYVVGSGIITIEEILNQNGFCIYGESPNMDTYSSEVFITRKEWIKQYPTKEFYPAQVMTLKKNVGENQQNMYIDNYNDNTNKFGKYAKIFMGAQKIQQSVDFKAVRVFIIYNFTINIPKYIQIKGRGVRNGALSMLPADQRNIRLYTLLSTSSVNNKENTIEYRRYKKKLLEYEEIQLIEKKINKYAINNYINKTGKFDSVDPLGALSFNIPKVKSEINTSTYFDYEHYQYVFQLINNLIKRAFISNPVWTKEQLWDYIRLNPASNINFRLQNYEKFYYKLYQYVLYNLLYINNPVNIKLSLYDIMNNQINRFHLDGFSYQSVDKVIINRDKYYILVPLDKYKNINTNHYSFLQKYEKNYFSEYQIEINKSKDLIIMNLDEFLNENIGNPILPYLFLVYFSTDEHYRILRLHIEGQIEIPKKVFNLYKKLKLAGNNWFVDYDTRNEYQDGKWEQFNKTNYSGNENDILIGIIGDKYFKLKKPENKIASDQRKKQKGLNCKTNKKKSLIAYYKKLNMVIPSKKRVTNMCDQILVKLIDMEIVSRNSKDGLKYVYTYDEI